MSSSRRAERRTYVVELKMGEHLVLGGARLQCAQHRAAVDELVGREIVDYSSPIELLYGDSDPVLDHLGA